MIFLSACAFLVDEEKLYMFFIDGWVGLKRQAEHSSKVSFKGRDVWQHVRCSKQQQQQSEWDGFSTTVQLKWTKCEERECKCGEGVRELHLWWVQEMGADDKNGWVKKMFEKGGQRESVRGAFERLQLNWLKEESIQVLQLKLGLQR